MTPDELVSALNWRYATKHFDPDRPLPEEATHALMEALRLAPSSFGLQPWKFIFVRDPELRGKLKAASWNQPQVSEASELVVIAARNDLEQHDIDRWMDCLATAQGQEKSALSAVTRMIEGFVDRMSPGERHAWNSRQCYIALGQLMTAAAVLGIDTCPLEGMDPAAYDVVLELGGTGYATCVACAIGYRSERDHTGDRPKARFARDEVVSVR
ncbi:NAD(P)H-dependent oxidoreductase [Haloferula sargassicola]|uniref:NAD(P)H nitroreductase YfkO n=1 Tax=Haloferula sargassicola TaxID=490096 RepID=A0ABP9UHB0_9BACT